MAFALYTKGLSMNAIAKLFQVSVPAVMKWIRNFARKNCEKPAPASAVVVELDEMWHFINSKKTNSGYGKPVAEIQKCLSTGNVDDVTRKLSPE